MTSVIEEVSKSGILVIFMYGTCSTIIYLAGHGILLRNGILIGD